MRTVPITSKTANNGAVSIATSSTQLLALNIARKGMIITNAGANPVYLFFGPGPAVAGQGAYLGASGGAAQLDLNAPCWHGAVYAIAVGGASNVTYVEFV